MTTTKSVHFWIGIIAALVPISLAGAVGYGTVKANVDEATRKVEVVEGTVNTNRERIVAQEKINLEQSIIQKQNVLLIERVTVAVDKLEDKVK